MVSWELPAPATDVGLNADEPTPPGRPVRDSATLPVKPLRVPTVTVYVVVSPAGTVLEAGAAATATVGGGGSAQLDAPETAGGVKLHLACVAESPARPSVTASVKPFTP